jgi:hypothetical protein
MALTDTDRAVLDFEASWWTTSGTKQAGIGELGLSQSAYYRRLAVLTDDVAAVAYAPLVVHRLRRRRRQRRRLRMEGTAAPEGGLR